MPLPIHSFTFRCGRCGKRIEYRDSGAYLGGYCPTCKFNYCAECATSQRCPSHGGEYLRKPDPNAESSGQRLARVVKLILGTAILVAACWIPYARWIAFVVFGLSALFFSIIGVARLIAKFKSPAKTAFPGWSIDRGYGAESRAKEMHFRRAGDDLGLALLVPERQAWNTHLSFNFDCFGCGELKTYEYELPNASQSDTTIAVCKCGAEAAIDSYGEDGHAFLFAVGVFRRPPGSRKVTPFTITKIQAEYFS